MVSISRSRVFKSFSRAYSACSHTITKWKLSDGNYLMSSLIPLTSTSTAVHAPPGSACISSPCQAAPTSQCVKKKVILNKRGEDQRRQSLPAFNGLEIGQQLGAGAQHWLGAYCISGKKAVGIIFTAVGQTQLFDLVFHTWFKTGSWAMNTPHVQVKSCSLCGKRSLLTVRFPGLFLCWTAWDLRAKSKSMASKLGWPWQVLYGIMHKQHDTTWCWCFFSHVARREKQLWDGMLELTGG